MLRFFFGTSGDEQMKEQIAAIEGVRTGLKTFNREVLFGSIRINWSTLKALLE
ncbi:MAG: hypothetical protein IJ214_08090 [Clostridia bacterium]|nr:hypothetical protein [Clostridia bacterium]